jgi:hypothetical protein
LVDDMSFITLLEPVHGSSTQVPLFTARHLQRWYAHDSCRLFCPMIHDDLCQIVP